MGVSEGDELGLVLGIAEGEADGRKLGLEDGLQLGMLDGSAEGAADGAADGVADGASTQGLPQKPTAHSLHSFGASQVTQLAPQSGSHTPPTSTYPVSHS